MRPISTYSVFSAPGHGEDGFLTRQPIVGSLSSSIKSIIRASSRPDTGAKSWTSTPTLMPRPDARKAPWTCPCNSHCPSSRSRNREYRSPPCESLRYGKRLGRTSRPGAFCTAAGNFTRANAPTRAKPASRNSARCFSAPTRPRPARVAVPCHRVLGAVELRDDFETADLVAQCPVPEHPDGVGGGDGEVPPPNDFGIHVGAVGKGPFAALDDAPVPEVGVRRKPGVTHGCPCLPSLAPAGRGAPGRQPPPHSANRCTAAVLAPRHGWSPLDYFHVSRRSSAFVVHADPGACRPP